MANMRDKLKFLLVQVREDQVMKNHEISVFLKSGNLRDDQIVSHDLLEKPVDLSALDRYDALIIGGSGDYSVLDRIPNTASLATILEEARKRKYPVLAACWGAQFLANVFGGKVIRDRASQELGTVTITKEPAGRQDPLFRDLPEEFSAQAGHNDRVAILPDDAVLLAQSGLCPVQAFTFPGSRIYGLQFHPELDKADLLLRLEHYRQNYVNDPEVLDEVIRNLRETPESATLVSAWIDRIVLADNV
jgi:GMP synthase (glutamine-hydrolysing)